MAKNWLYFVSAMTNKLRETSFFVDFFVNPFIGFYLFNNDCNYKLFVVVIISSLMSLRIVIAEGPFFVFKFETTAVMA